MPRPSNREKLLQLGQDLLQTGGFTATGVKEVTDAGGVPKGSFYNYFRSKDEFGVEVLRRYGRIRSAQLEASLVDAEGAPVERLAALFDGWMDQEREGGYATGCLAGNLGQELAGRNPVFREEIDQLFRESQRYITEVLFEAQQAGELSTDEDPDELAAFIYNSWQGALVRMKATGSDRPLQQFRRVIFAQLLRPDL
jgi:TetR/AcrR family transcriptional repressor of nem operon